MLPLMAGYERIAIILGAVIVAGSLLWLLVRAYGKQHAARAASETRNEAHDENTKARTRFDIAVGRPLSNQAKDVVARYRARRRRRGLHDPDADQ